MFNFPVLPSQLSNIFSEETSMSTSITSSKSSGVLSSIKSFISYLSPTPTRAEDCKTVEDLIDYAYSIRKTQPSFSDEIFAAVNRAV